MDDSWIPEPYQPISTDTLRDMAKAPTTFPAWALREALNELVRRREAERVQELIGATCTP